MTEAERRDVQNKESVKLEELVTRNTEIPRVVRRRLPSLALLPPPLAASRHLISTRRLLSGVQGGLPRGLISCCRPNAHEDKTKMKCVFLHSKSNPFAPTHPGRPGLVLGTLKGLPETFPLFFQSGRSYDDCVTYLGDYSCDSVHPLALEEWRGIPRTVRLRVVTQEPLLTTIPNRSKTN